MDLVAIGANRFHFQCTQCGACCRRAGLVYLRPEEPARLARARKLSLRVFRARYLSKLPDGREVIEVPADGSGCPLLDGNLCSVEAVKPDQCRSYPFWQELVEDQDAYRSERDDCEGIGKGPRVPTAHVTAMLALDPGPEGPPVRSRRRSKKR